VSLLKGETSVAEAARTHGLTVAEVDDWRERFLSGAENALRTRPTDEAAVKDEPIKKLKQKSYCDLTRDGGRSLVLRGLLLVQQVCDSTNAVTTTGIILQS
jgi:transposase-like protein